MPAGGGAMGKRMLRGWQVPKAGKESEKWEVGRVDRKEGVGRGR